MTPMKEQCEEFSLSVILSVMPSFYPASLAQGSTAGPPPILLKHLLGFQDFPSLHPFHCYHHGLEVLASLSLPEKKGLSQRPV